MCCRDLVGAAVAETASEGREADDDEPVREHGRDAGQKALPPPAVAFDQEDGADDALQTAPRQQGQQVLAEVLGERADEDEHDPAGTVGLLPQRPWRQMDGPTRDAGAQGLQVLRRLAPGQEACSKHGEDDEDDEDDDLGVHREDLL